MDDDGFDGLWKHVEAGWDDPARHATFIETARVTDGLRSAAARYRAVVDLDDARRPEAEKRLGAIALLAVAALEAAKTPPRTKPPTWLTIASVIAAILVTYFIAKMMGR